MECKYHEICSLTDEFDPEEGLCILHSHQQHKDQKAFAEALAAHRKSKEGQFAYMVFPGGADFSGATITGGDFTMPAFTEEVDFHGAIFTEAHSFTYTTFTEDADFHNVTFTNHADFSMAIFTR
jgi:uncharacterized protein YjbI with pentapeptide repeats